MPSSVLFRIMSSTKLQKKKMFQRFLFFSFCNFRRKRREQLVCVSLPVLGGVIDGAGGFGYTGIELCDLLQRKGDQLQGKSLHNCTCFYFDFIC